MKVLNLMEFIDLDKDNIRQDYIEKRDYILSIPFLKDLANMSELTLILIYKDFMKQPFIYELITKYFNWEYDGILEDVIEDEEGDGHIIEILHFHNWHTNGVGSDIAMNVELNMMQYENASFYIPETLDDFIRDCQRAETKLEWRIK